MKKYQFLGILILGDLRLLEFYFLYFVLKLWLLYELAFSMILSSLNPL